MMCVVRMTFDTQWLTRPRPHVYACTHKALCSCSGAASSFDIHDYICGTTCIDRPTPQTLDILLDLVLGFEFVILQYTFAPIQCHLTFQMSHSIFRSTVAYQKVSAVSKKSLNSGQLGTCLETEELVL